MTGLKLEINQRTIFNRAAVSVVILFAATLLAGILHFTAQVILARELGAIQFGHFSSALAIVTLMAPLAGFGLASYWLKIFGQEGVCAYRWLASSFDFIISSTFIVVAMLFLWAWFGPHDQATKILIIVLSSVVFGQVSVDLVTSKFQLQGRYTAVALWQLSPHLLKFLSLVTFLLVFKASELSIRHAVTIFSVVALICLCFCIHQMRLMYKAGRELNSNSVAPTPTRGEKSDADRPSLKAVMKGAWPFGLAGFFYLVYFQSDIIFVKYMVGAEAAGIYNVAFLIIVSLYLFPAVIYQKFLLPKLHRWAYHDATRFREAYRIGNALMLVPGVVAMMLLWWIAPIAVPWIFGDDYVGAVPILMVLAVAIPFRFLASSAGAMLATRNYMRVKIRLMAGAALLNVTLNAVIIYYYGAIGAAVATVITEAFTSFAYIFAYKKLARED